MFNFDEQLVIYKNRFEQKLSEFFDTYSNNSDKDLFDMIKYAVFNGGKRIRPSLLYASAEMLGLDLSVVDCYAIAIELIHSYSLVHDDLPAMDNDDYRRGKLSTHKKFGEANGILCGDALLNLAFETVLSKKGFNEFDQKASQILFEYSGMKGMIFGQFLDVKNEYNIIDETLLYKIYENKTSKLLTAPLLISSALSKNKYYKELLEFGTNFGYLFQLTDDILDVEGDFKDLGKSINKDKDEDKLTAIKVFGIEKSKKIAVYLCNKCIDIISNVDNNDFFIELVKTTYNRKK